MRTSRWCGSALFPAAVAALLSACADSPVAPELATVPDARFASGAAQKACSKMSVTAFGLEQVPVHSVLQVTQPSGSDVLTVGPCPADANWNAVRTLLNDSPTFFARIQPMSFGDGQSVSITFNAAAGAIVQGVIRRQANGNLRAIVRYDWDFALDFRVDVTRNGTLLRTAHGAGQVGIMLPPNFSLSEWDLNNDDYGGMFLRGHDGGGNVIEVHAIVSPRDPASGLPTGARNVVARFDRGYLSVPCVFLAMSTTPPA